MSLRMASSEGVVVRRGMPWRAVSSSTAAKSASSGATISWPPLQRLCRILLTELSKVTDDWNRVRSTARSR